jgi:hypothetical protein
VLPWQPAAALADCPLVWAVALVPHQPEPAPALSPQRAPALARLPAVADFALLLAE